MPTPGLSLVGFLDEKSAINHLRGACVVTDPSDAALAAEWQVAKAKLGLPFPGAGNPEILPMPADAAQYMGQLMQEQWVKNAFQTTLLGASFQLVEIEPLLAFQLTVDMARSDHHNNGVNGAPSLDDLLKICLPLAPAVDGLQVYQSPGSMLITSRSLNFQTFAQGFLQGQFLGMQVGVSLPFMHVVRHNGRCYLHNGFHRAVGLRNRGATHVPCIFRDVQDHQAVGIKPQATFDVAQLESADPPTLAHFTRGRAYDVQLKAFSRTLHVSWSEYVTTHE